MWPSTSPEDQAPRAGRRAVPTGEHPWSHVFYLYIPSTKNANRPYLQIPLQVQHHHDLWQEVSPDAAHHH